MRNFKTFKLMPTAIWLVGIIFAIQARANLYFDVNGATSGFGIVNGGNYSWDSAFWSTSATGVASTTAYPTGAGNFPRFTPPASAAFTNTVNGDEHMAGLFTTVSTATMVINSAGSGFLDVDSGDQGFLLSLAEPSLSMP